MKLRYFTLVISVVFVVATTTGFSGVLLDDDFSQEDLGDDLSELTNWKVQGTPSHGGVIDHPLGSGTNALWIGQGSGIRGENLDVANVQKFTFLVDFTDPVVGSDWFAMFFRDNTSYAAQNTYRVQWYGTYSTILVKKQNHELASIAKPADFKDGNMHTIELKIDFDPSSDPKQGTNILRLVIDGTQVGPDMYDIGGVTDNDYPAHDYTNRVLATADSVVYVYNFNNEATASNILSRVMFEYADQGTLIIVE